MPDFWQVRFPMDPSVLDELLTGFDERVSSIAAFEDTSGGWVCELLARERLEVRALHDQLLSLLGDDAPPAAAISVAPLTGRDWLEATRRSFPPLRVGRFWLHGSHVEETPPRGSVPILIDAGTAFGSGEHGSTRGCLLALDALARRRYCRTILDMGCGSAVLAIAALKCWPTARARAVDIDASAVEAAATNARRNRVAGRLRAFVADGYDRQVRRQAKPVDLVFANILAGPLTEMATDLARVLAPGGEAVLSGLLAVQAEAVLVAHRRQGLRLSSRVDVDGWTTLLFRRPPRRHRVSSVRHPSPFAVERRPATRQQRWD